MVEVQFKVNLIEPASARLVNAMDNKVILSEAGVEYVHFTHGDMMMVIGTDDMNIEMLIEFLAAYCDPVTNIGLVTQIVQWEPEWNRI